MSQSLSNRPIIILSSGKDQSLRRFHPWVFSGAIKKIKGEIAEGMLADVYSNHDDFLGCGHYSEGSIAVRILSFTQRTIDQHFWNEKIKNALEYRVKTGITGRTDTDAFRLVHAEGDGLPGLIIDKYGSTVVIQCHSTGMYMNREEIKQALMLNLGAELTCIYDKSSETLSHQKGSSFENGWLLGDLSETIVKEYGYAFKINWITGQKTGFFLDQRENRKLLEKYCAGKKVLNTFCYSGGFSVYALGGGATLVHSVDSSKKAIALTDENVRLNFGPHAPHASYAVDTFSFMEQSDTVYDLIILDPPAFAKHIQVKHNAVQGYKRLNALAMKKLKPGGILFTFSCSQAVDKYLFHHTITAAAIQCGREIKILEYMGQPADHAASIFHPEGEYLKGLVVYVGDYIQPIAEEGNHSV